MIRKYLPLTLLTFLFLSMVLDVGAQVVFSIQSPNEKIDFNIRLTEKIELEVLHDSSKLLSYSEIALEIDNNVLGVEPKVIKKTTNSIDEVIFPVAPEKFSRIKNRCNEMTLVFKGKYRLNFRAYNEGVAWQWETSMKEKVTVNEERLVFQFPDSSYVWFPEEESFFSHNERYYLFEPMNGISDDRFCSLPTLIETNNNCKVLITESSLFDFPGMWLKGTGFNSLNAIFPGMALKEEQTNDRNVKVIEHSDDLAITDGTRKFPWRILAIAEKDADLINNQLSFILSEPCAIDDPSWIEPGKVAWDWWNDWNIYGVDFKAGVNTETYKYYIDFASIYGIEYIIMDEGWYELGDLMKVVPEIDMEEIMRYAQEKNVGVILWVIWKTLEDQWKESFDQFEKWGVKGIKVDFMQRDDQWMVDYYHRVAKEAADRKMLVDFHGAYKPSGLRRKYPNVITREGVRGLEQVKWSDLQTPTHNVTLPFIRMVAGPMDYTPGAMLNATEKNYYASWSQPMSMGTRCHQLAMFVVYESPLQMLCDNPSNYYREPDCMEFLASVPTVWDTTIVLSAKIGEYIAIARKRGEDWYVGAMTSWDNRELRIDFSFLDEGTYKIDYYQDGINADRYASDFRRQSEMITAFDMKTIFLAPGGGWVARISPR